MKRSTPELDRIASLAPEAKPFPTRRQYRVGDFVFFSHARHATSKVECQSCHGAVYKHEAGQPAVPATMNGCIGCHKQRGASIACNKCHELNQ